MPRKLPVVRCLSNGRPWPFRDHFKSIFQPFERLLRMMPSDIQCQIRWRLLQILRDTSFPFACFSSPLSPCLPCEGACNWLQAVRSFPRNARYSAQGCTSGVRPCFGIHRLNTSESIRNIEPWSAPILVDSPNRGIGSINTLFTSNPFYQPASSRNNHRVFASGTVSSGDSPRKR